MERTTVLILTCDELWLAHSVVRHEIQQREQWQYPPASLELNEEIASALLFCEENSLAEASVPVSYGDLLALDYLIPQDAKSANGTQLGKPLLMKTFVARRAIAEGDWNLVEEPTAPAIQEVIARLSDPEGE